jgi:thiosulfate reductase cytochrome b subunit
MRAIKFTFAGDVKASDTMYSVLFWSAVALLAAWIFFVVFEMVKGLYPVQQLPRVPDEARHDQDKESHSIPTHHSCEIPWAPIAVKKVFTT